ncbi:MAG TPA: ATP-binding protein, partial [Thermoanaerobaculia bacterium]|nr:ATP-binding protein [Thermoanaerobaculia bacterium]
MTETAPFWRRLDPRSSVASRLLLGFFLAFCIPGAAFVFLLERRLSELERVSVKQLAAVRVADAVQRIEQDARFCAEWIDRRAGLLEESAASLALAVSVELAGEKPLRKARAPLVPDARGGMWTDRPDSGTVAWLDPGRASDPAALADLGRTGNVAPLMTGLLERRAGVRSVTIRTASGAFRRAPWTDPHSLSSGSVEPEASAPAHRSPGALGAWSDLHASSSGRFVTLSVPVRDGSGARVGEVALDVDAPRLIAESFPVAELSGDLFFVADASGHVVVVTPATAAALGWSVSASDSLARAPDASRGKLWRSIRQAIAAGQPVMLPGRDRLTAASIGSTGWVVVEGLSAAALGRLESETRLAVEPRSFAALQRDVLLLFTYLLLAVLGAVLLVSRRITEPVQELVRAAEAIGDGRAVRVAGSKSSDEVGRLSAAIETMGRRVARRVETLRRLHQLSRAGFRTTDRKEILARSSEAIGAFTRAEMVIFLLHDPNTNRLDAVWPGWNLSEELADEVKIPVDARSIASTVFKSGEPYATNDIEHDPFHSGELQKLFGTRNALFAPLKTESETFGVVVAINRPGSFGREEIDAMTSFADVASLLLKNARLYATLTGTVEELRRASRLKDHFLQNVNHELRTPLTAIVGWTDLFSEEDLDEKTVRRGLAQVRQSARVLLALIDDLLDLARMDRGSLSLDRRLISLPDVIQRSIDTVRMMAEGRSVAVICAPLPMQMVSVRADPLRLQQVMWNLLANAIKFSRRHGRIVVRVEREPERYLISVEDDGIGISASELPHVFERFRQV